MELEYAKELGMEVQRSSEENRNILTQSHFPAGRTIWKHDTEKTDTAFLDNTPTYLRGGKDDRMAKRKQTPEQKLTVLAADLEREITHWKQIYEDGGSDPSWPDGTNLNLTRNHVIYQKRDIRKLCTENHLSLPETYFLPTPPTVADSYMANLNQTRRVERLRAGGTELTTEKIDFDEDQTALF